METIIAHFSEKDIALLRSNLDELNQAGKVGNAHSIAVLLDHAIKRAKETLPAQDGEAAEN